MLRLLVIKLLLLSTVLFSQTFKSKLPLVVPQGGFSGNLYPAKSGVSYVGNSLFPYRFGFFKALYADTLKNFTTEGFNNTYYPQLNASIIDGIISVYPAKNYSNTTIGAAFRPFYRGFFNSIYADDSNGNSQNVMSYVESSLNNISATNNIVDTSNVIYLMSTFNDGIDTGDQLYLYASTDGLNFTHIYADQAYNTADFDTAAGVRLRDPSIIKYGNYYYATYTTDWSNDTLGIARSADLLRWEHWHDIPTTSTVKLWAPEFFVENDGTVYIAGSHYSNSPRLKYYTATDSTLQNWSGPTDFTALDVGITGAVNDIYIYKVGSVYHALYSKNSLYLEHSTAANYGGPYTIQDTIFSAENNEGPAVWKIGNTYRIAFFLNSDGTYWYVDTDDWSTYTTPAQLSGIVWGHFSVVELTDARSYLTVLSAALHGKASSRTSIGAFNIINKDSTIGIGRNVTIDGINSVGIGQGVTVNHDNAVALGKNAQTTKDNQIRIGTSSDNISVPNVVEFDNTTTPVSNPTGAYLYAASGELIVKDAAGNVTTISPHNFLLVDKSEEMAWSYYSERDSLIINIDMLKALRILESLSGEKIVYIQKK